MGGDVLDRVEARVREEIRRRGVDPVRDSDVVRGLVDEVLTDWNQQALAGGLAPVEDRAAAARTLLSNVAGLSPSQQEKDVSEAFGTLRARSVVSTLSEAGSPRVQNARDIRRSWTTFPSQRGICSAYKWR